SKTGINYCPPGATVPLKNAIGVYENPTAVLIDQDFLKNLPNLEKKVGLSECLKHGLLQDTGLLEEVYRLLRSTDPPYDACMRAALQTMHLKRTVLSFDPWEEGVAQVLLFGHLHAHSLERASGFTVTHGQAVFYGLLVDLKLGGASQNLYDEV